MHAWPALSTKRSRSGQWGLAGLWRSTSRYSRYASGASAIAVPGWPAFACWTASMDRVRIVSMESCSISELGNGPPAVAFRASVSTTRVSARLREQVEEALVLGPHGGEGRVPLGARLDDRRDRRRGRRDAVPLER